MENLKHDGTVEGTQQGGEVGDIVASQDSVLKAKSQVKLIKNSARMSPSKQ